MAIELSYILETKIKNFKSEKKLEETGIVLSMIDDIARCYGSTKIQAGEMVEFNKGNIKGMALNLEPYVVGAVVFSNERDIQKGNFIKRTCTKVSTLGLFNKEQRRFYSDEKKWVYNEVCDHTLDSDGTVAVEVEMIFVEYHKKGHNCYKDGPELCEGNRKCSIDISTAILFELYAIKRDCSSDLDEYPEIRVYPFESIFGGDLPMIEYILNNKDHPFHAHIQDLIKFYNK